MYTPQNSLIQCSVSEYATSFYCVDHESRKIATAELSKLFLSYGHRLYLNGHVPKSCYEQPWYYFNRIKKPVEFTPNNVAILLYQEIARWADHEHVNIWNDIMPYGKLTAEQIYTVEHLFGFIKIDNSITTIRLENHAH